jgi:hypothetical protein
MTPLPQTGAGPQTFGVPLPPQVSGRVHVPQSRVPPQPSAIIPQFAPTAAHVVGVQHVPNDFLLDLTHTPLQHLSLVRHLWPSPMHGPAPATRHPTTMSAAVSIVTSNGARRVSDRFMTSSSAGRPPRRALRDQMSDRGVVQSAPKHKPCPSVNWYPGVVPPASHISIGRPARAFPVIDRRA